MNPDLTNAKSTLSAESLTCVLCRDDKVFKSSEKGISPLIKWLESGDDFKGFSAADKVVGKGAAYLYVLLGIKSLYAAVLSKSAKEVLNRFGIEVFYDENPDRILNRDKTGFCPIESAVTDIDTPTEALIAIKKRLEELKK
ncbi:MAG: DUF1893 domain-containing protein [Clostridia bacterium]|nr:DUF1893 domain-containing protein [Clostridia bacterium]